jgi:hypothetical protein
MPGVTRVGGSVPPMQPVLLAVCSSRPPARTNQDWTQPQDRHGIAPSAPEVPEFLALHSQGDDGNMGGMSPIWFWVVTPLKLAGDSSSTSSPRVRPKPLPTFFSMAGSWKRGKSSLTMRNIPCDLAFPTVKSSVRNDDPPMGGGSGLRVPSASSSADRDDSFDPVALPRTLERENCS